MECIEEIIKLLHKKKAVREKQHEKMEKEQIAEYNNLMNTLQTVKNERNDCKQNLTKNLQRLTTCQHAIEKLIHSSEHVPGLPVSHDYQRKAILFLTEGIDFINQLQNTYKNFYDSNEESNINPSNLTSDITSCTNIVGSELYEIKSLIIEIATLQRNVDMLQKYCLFDNKEDLEI